MEDKSWQPKCPDCNEPLNFMEDEDTGHQWWYCSNADCGNLGIYDHLDEIEGDSLTGMKVKEVA